MQSDGVISTRQAEMLLASLEPRAAAGREPLFLGLRAGQLLAFLIVAVAIAAIIGLYLLTAGGPAEIQDVAQTLNKAEGHGEMNRTTTSLLAIVLLASVPLLIFALLYNSLVGKEETVLKDWAQVESNFQRRADLIPALVQTVSRYLTHEAETFGDVAEKRSRMTQTLQEEIDGLIKAQRDASEILRGGQANPVEDQQRLDQLFAAQEALKSRIGNVVAVVEAYPDLRSSDQFLELQAQIEGTENRINVARQRFNSAVGRYNASLRMLPWNLVASLGNFKRKAYFRSRDDAENAPDMAFD